MLLYPQLFSQVLLGYKTKQDLDTLVHRLEENHGILTQMAERENGSEVSSALPKLLLELVSQVDENNDRQAEEKSEELDQEPSEEVMTKEEAGKYFFNLYYCIIYPSISYPCSLHLHARQRSLSIPS